MSGCAWGDLNQIGHLTDDAYFDCGGTTWTGPFRAHQRSNSTPAGSNLRAIYFVTGTSLTRPTSLLDSSCDW
jgi:hypothetical protein